MKRGVSSAGRASASQAECREFDSRTPLQISSSYFLRYLHDGTAGNPIADIRLSEVKGSSMSANQHKSLYKRPPITSSDIVEHLIASLKVR